MGAGGTLLRTPRSSLATVGEEVVVVGGTEQGRDAGSAGRDPATIESEVRELEHYLEQAPPHASGRDDIRERLERARRELARARREAASG